MRPRRRKPIDGEKLKFIRVMSGMAQREAADSLGISRSTLSQLELGNLDPPATLLRRIGALYVTHFTVG